MNGNPFLGWHYFWQGFLALREPGLRRFVALPLLLNIVVMSAASWWGGSKLNGWIESLVAGLPGWLDWLYWLLLPLAWLMMLLVMAYFFSTLLVTLGSPLNGLLSEQVERRAGVVLPEESLPAMIRRTLGRELTKLGYLLPRYLLLLALSFIPGLNLASPLLWFWFGSWVVALQYMDYSFDNHGRSFVETRQAMAGDNLTVLGFGAVVALLMMIPLVNWFVMPAAVIGATRLRLERMTAQAGSVGGFGYAEGDTHRQRLADGRSEYSDRR
ncbi:MAG: sulfate transporter CysZ [Saccharospirillaceae bacterium]|nr:sulfate transporter CysZ [Saccharospirillaceae bacterium]MCD8531468.1 sulfate transporter CysZ [Saccharospirillaceae bacterium]